VNTLVEAAEQGHEQRRTNTFIAHIGDDQRHPAALRQLKAIVKIAGDFARGVEAGGNLPAGWLRQHGRQKALLDLACDLYVALQLSRFSRSPPRNVWRRRKLMAA